MPQPANSRAAVVPGQLGAAQRQPELAVAAGVEPAHRAGVAAAVHALELADHRGGVRGRACRRPPRSGAPRRSARAARPGRATRCAAACRGRRWPGAGRWPGSAGRARSGALSVVQNGSSARTSESTASACSARSLAEPSSAAASRSSSAPAPRGAVPARTRADSCRPVRRSSSSGVAPSRPSTANVQQSGKRAASRRSSRRGSSGTSAETSRSRARTTLASSPASIRPTAVATAAHQVAGSRAPSA